jgi:hypothetical protein
MESKILMENEPNDSVSVKVAVRVRPLIGRELNEMAHGCVSVLVAQKTIIFGKSRNDTYEHSPYTTGTAFQFDYVYGNDSEQHQLFEESVVPLLDTCLEGYNATVFAYGQTGSGKSYTMGTAVSDIKQSSLLKTAEMTHIMSSNMMRPDMGVVPRAMYYLFEKIRDPHRLVLGESDVSSSLSLSATHVHYEVKVAFLELYNEDLLDLLASAETKWPLQQLTIREEFGGSIYVAGITETIVNTAEAALECLKLGMMARKTASTDMNDVSSRSHAIFTVSLERRHYTAALEDESSTCLFSVKSKFHFVDLAGSERLKRTHAIGERAKEGISINQGLLALGNVINALSDTAKKGGHVPYRDSKLTRLLQDSLGGNSRTLMIACISPADSSFTESINTLNYASRAKSIKNRSVVNLELSKDQEDLGNLRKELHRLQSQLSYYEQTLSETRK